jgi:hypothetical protein
MTSPPLLLDGAPPPYRRPAYRAGGGARTTSDVRTGRCVSAQHRVFPPSVVLRRVRRGLIDDLLTTADVGQVSVSAATPADAGGHSPGGWRCEDRSTRWPAPSTCRVGQATRIRVGKVGWRACRGRRHGRYTASSATGNRNQLPAAPTSTDPAQSLVLAPSPYRNPLVALA